MRNNEDTFELHAAREPLEQWQQDVIDDQKPIFGVLDDVDQIVRVEAKVQRVEDATRSWNAEVGLQVGVVVPHERRHAITAVEARREKSLAQGPGPTLNVRVGVPPERLVGFLGNDLDPGEELSGASEEVCQGQRVVHHGALHSILHLCPNARSLLVRALGASLLARLPVVGPLGPGSLRSRRVQ